MIKEHTGLSSLLINVLISLLFKQIAQFEKLEHENILKLLLKNLSLNYLGIWFFVCFSEFYIAIEDYVVERWPDKTINLNKSSIL